MKKLLFLAILLGTFSSSFAFLTQSNWRWRNNNGTETSATWKAAQNTAITYNSIHEVLRLRVEVYNNTNDAIALEDSIQYTTTPGDANSWRNILANDDSRAFVMAGASSTVAQNTPTTSQITGNTYPFVAGKVMSDSAILKFVSIPPSNRSEFEWAIMGTKNTLPNTTYYFKHWGSTANNLPPGVTYPSLTTGATLPVKLTSFTAKKEAKRVRLDWSTATEVNSDKFEVLKSSDGTKWNVLTTVKAHGTTAESRNYTSFDDKPSNGINYYRLKQFDLDGKFTFSEVKSLRFDDKVNAIITVSPNPTRGMVNFKLTNTSATNLTVSLANANGKTVFTEVFKSVEAGTSYKMNFSKQPTPGMYILTLQAEGLLQSVKVIIE